MSTIERFDCKKIQTFDFDDQQQKPKSIEDLIPKDEQNHEIRNELNKIKIMEKELKKSWKLVIKAFYQNKFYKKNK